MKFLVVMLLVCSALAYVKCNEAHKQLAAKVIAECQAETKASDDDVTALKTHKVANSPEDKCLRACVLKKLEIIDSNGKMNKEKFIEAAKIRADGDENKAALMIEIIESCAPIQVPDDHCEASAQYSDCIVQTAKDKGLELPPL